MSKHIRRNQNDNKLNENNIINEKINNTTKNVNKLNNNKINDNKINENKTNEDKVNEITDFNRTLIVGPSFCVKTHLLSNILKLKKN